MKICIDTNIYSLLRTGDREIVELLETCDDVYVPAIVLGELYAGFYQGTRIRENLIELDLFLNMPGVHIIETDKNIADRYGILLKMLKKQGTPIPTNDVWIAATTLAKGAKLATKDSHFDNIPGICI